MENRTTREKLRTIRKLQTWAPIFMIVLGILVGLLWKDKMSTMVGAIIAFLAIPDYFAFKMVGDSMEANLDES